MIYNYVDWKSIKHRAFAIPGDVKAEWFVFNSKQLKLTARPHKGGHSIFS